ncbi:MAG: 2-oxoglutarate dehydrogenase E1 component [Schleiferiaceae bacterium]|jgi:2-oxoglutarate dehydrogenase E1 component|nr:2-oxoglutarate dehydrogenase E1 component [Schleiferiaceae bacterium]|tara:strand:- start:5606 stop:8332 length:2727 start_codon:yes stop_codon:yes gene_type:complete
MDRFSFLGSIHAQLIDDQYEHYLKNPDGIEPSWRAFFQGYDFAKEIYSEEDLEGAGVPEEVIKEFHVLNLIQGYRSRGHLFTKTNPVRMRRSYEPTLDIENFGLSKDDLDTPFNAATELGLPGATKLREIISHLEAIYCQSTGVEYNYIRDPERRTWIKNWIHKDDNQPKLSIEEKKQILHKLNQAVSFESFLNTKFVGQKRFSIEGAEALIPGLDEAVNHGARYGVKEFVLGMAHRGRLNVLTNVFGKPRKQIFSEFEGKAFDDVTIDGDVKYHLGHTTVHRTVDGNEVVMNIAPNPSHLEAVDPVVEGIARAKINNDYGMESGKVLPILIHGDAAVAAQGVVYETLQMEKLAGYSTGGTLHIVINNQVGFTTNYLDARSSTYCTDIAKVILAPVLHVNGDDPEALVHAMRLAIEYRQRFQRDIFIDLLCYRKYGHNEGDEPRFTQPLLYKAISKHPNPREIYAQRLMSDGVATQIMVKEMQEEFKSMLELDFDEAKKIKHNVITPFMEKEWVDYPSAEPGEMLHPVDTTFDLDKLKDIAKHITTLPEGKKFLKKTVRLMGDRAAQVFERNSIDWGMGELLAYGSLLAEDYNIRISGEDVERGTFSHRHAILKVEDSGEEVNLLNEYPGKEGRFAIYNSLLSEYAVMGFDYGYAMASPDTLTIWEAQFGDFANGAQIMIDQFLTAAEDKWKVQNGLVLLLPHGYEGQGAEHSSARLERFLQMCAQENMTVANCTTPANFYHLLRRQHKRNFRRPLVVMSPKSLLRLPKAQSSMEELAHGTFQPILSDTTVAPEKVTKVVFCSGKLYYELANEREAQVADHVAIIRIEQLYPLDDLAIKQEVAKYPNAAMHVWAQEEPANMGAWTYMLWQMHQPLTLVSPAPSAATASGSNKVALQRQRETIERVFSI